MSRKATPAELYHAVEFVPAEHYPRVMARAAYERLKRGLSMAKLSKLVRIPPERICLLENRKSIGGARARRLAKAFNIDPATLLDEVVVDLVELPRASSNTSLGDGVETEGDSK